MNRLIVFVTLILCAALTLGGCGTFQRRSASAPNAAPGSASAAVADNSGTITAAPATTPSTPESNALADQATAVADNPLVRLLTNPTLQHDAEVTIQISNYGGNDDKVVRSCAAFIRSPETLRKASELAGLKALADEAKQIAVVAPIAPAGLLSGVAELRRAERDIASGGVSDRVAAFRGRLHTERKKLMDLRDDARLACSALVLDTLNAPLRLTVKALPLIAELRRALSFEIAP